MKHTIFTTLLLAAICIFSAQKADAAFVVKCDKDTVLARKDVLECAQKTTPPKSYVEDYKQKKGGALGILAIVFAATLLGPLAIILGALGLRHNCRYKGLAKIGLAIGIIETLLLVVLFIALLSSPFTLNMQFAGPMMPGLI